MSDSEHKVRRVRHPWRTAAVIAAPVLILGLLLAVASVIPLSSDTARRGVITALEDELDAEVELAGLEFRLLPSFRAVGHGLTIRHRGRRDVPPMIQIARFSAEGTIRRLLRRHVTRLEVEHLEIQIPPDRNRDTATPEGEASAAPRREPDSRELARLFVIDELVSTDSRLVMIPRDPTRDPKIWEIHHLRMTSISPDTAMPFVATLSNAVPPGEIETSGSFGPWRREDPGQTPIEGDFSFANADLKVFNGIAGILSSHGTFAGSLDHMTVRGNTDTPDFMVTAGGHPFSLKTTYHAVVDGTNGNTFLEQVNATFLRSSLTARGEVTRTPGRKGRTVTLDVVMDRARLEDILTMAVKTPQPPMTGALKLRTKFVLPPGELDVVRKLRLDGRFEIGGTRFTDAGVQTKINTLSQRTQGNTKPEETPANVASRFVGTFKLSNSQLEIPDVTFDVPGSTVRLAGGYGLLDERIDFAGMAYTDAKLSQMTTGWKSLLLKPVDLLFRKDGGGAAIPVKITGTRNEPSFGLDRGRIFKRRSDAGE